MNEPVNGFEFLESLRKGNGKPEQSFKSFSNYLDEKAREKGIPVHGQFELTPLCNFSCKMCYVHLNADQLAGRQIISIETWKNLMHQAWEAGMMHATLTGGECLIYPGFDELFLFLHSLGCEISVFTNGYLLDDSRIEFFLQHTPSAIQITLYGCNEDVYERVTGERAFSTVVENARKAVEAGLPVRISVTPSRYLGEDVLETVRIGKDISKAFLVNAGIFTPREETGRSQQRDDLDVDEYIRIHRLLNKMEGREAKEIDSDMLPAAGGSFHECDEYGLLCGAGRSSFVVDWKGTMIPCNHLDMVRSYPLKDGFHAAWSSINLAANSWPRVPECKGCAYRSVCNTCAAAMLQYASPGKQPVEICEKTRHFVRHGIVSIPNCE